jgi:tetratricopeptide (TPR) repeat protein
LTELEPDTPEHFDILADVYISLNDRGNAIQALDKLLALQPDNKAAHEKKAGLLVGGNVEEIIAAQLKMVELEPEVMKHRTDLAKTYHGDARFEKAVVQLNIVVAKEPENVYALELLGDCHKQLENHKDAVTTYKRILEINPEDVKNMCNLADSYTALGSYAIAVSTANKALKIKEGYGQAYMSLGFAYQTSAERCSSERGETKFDDKLVYKMASDIFEKAMQDQMVRSEAKRFHTYLKELIPTKEDYFMNKHKFPKDPCYNWIQ